MKDPKNINKKDQSLDKSSMTKDKKSIIIYDGQFGTISDNKSDFSLSMTKNFDKVDDDIISKSSEEDIDDKLNRLMKIKKEGGKISDNFKLKKNQTQKPQKIFENSKQYNSKENKDVDINKINFRNIKNEVTNIYYCRFEDAYTLVPTHDFYLHKGYIYIPENDLPLLFRLVFESKLEQTINKIKTR